MQQPTTSHVDLQALTSNQDFGQIGPLFVGASLQQQVSKAQQLSHANHNNVAAANTVLVSSYSMSPMMSAPGAPRMSFAGNMMSANTSAAAAAAAAGIRLPLMSPMGLHGLPPGPRTPDGQPLLSPLGSFPGFPYPSVMPPLESPTSLLQARLQHSPGFPFPQHGPLHPQQVFFPGPGAFEEQASSTRGPNVDKMSWLDAAETILDEAQQPLALQDIKQRIKDQALVGTNARSSLETVMQRDALKGSKRFVKLPGTDDVFRLMTAEEKRAARKNTKKAPKQAAKVTGAKTSTSTTPTEATEAPSVTMVTAATAPPTKEDATTSLDVRNTKFRRKCQNIRRLIKEMVFENAALCDEVARTEAKLPRARAERRFLLLRLLHYQALTGHSILDSDRLTAKKEAAAAKEGEKSGKKERVTKKEREKEKREKEEKDKKKEKNRHKHKKAKKPPKVEAEKKVDAKKKKANSSLKRYILPIPMTEEGRPVFPIVLGSLTVYSLGAVLPDLVSFHTDRFIHPAGFHSTRVYGSMDDPSRKCVYTCRIMNVDGEAKFEISDDNKPPVVLSAGSATKCHKKLLQAVNKAFGEDIVNESRDRAQEFFGVSHPTVQNLIQGLPGANQCALYRWLRFEECRPEEREKVALWYESDPTVCYSALVAAYKKRQDERLNTPATPTPTSTLSSSSSPSASLTTGAGTSVTTVTVASESHNLRSLLTAAPIVTPHPTPMTRASVPSSPSQGNS